ncbi:MAG: glycosyltransferase family 39 protein [Chloroflexi bacterium]|nr:glycosyltransferase family 39 protein [Chloroflexota bacterium]
MTIANGTPAGGAWAARLMTWLAAHGALTAICLLAFVVRGAWALSADRFDPILAGNAYHGDAVDHHALAVHLVRGLGYTWDGATPTAYRMPGYPLFLAALYVTIGQALLGVRLVQAAIGAALCLPVYRIARDLAGPKRALVAALSTALYPTLVYMTGWLYSETLFITVLWLALALAGRAMAYPAWKAAAAGGAVLGVAVMIRPEVALWPALLFILALLIRWPARRLRVIMAVQIIALAVALPWAVRNTIQLGSWVLLTTSGGSNLYAGNNPRADGGSAWVYPVEGLSEVESDRALMRRSLDWIKAEPMAALALVPRKIAKFIAPLERETGGNTGTLATIINIPFAAFLVAALAGFVRLRDNLRAVMLASLFTWYLLMAVVFYGGSRIALPVAPALVIFACAAWPNRSGRDRIASLSDRS